MLVAGFWMLDIRCLILDAGYWMLEFRINKSNVQERLVSPNLEAGVFKNPVSGIYPSSILPHLIAWYTNTLNFSCISPWLCGY